MHGFKNLPTDLAPYFNLATLLPKLPFQLMSDLKVLTCIHTGEILNLSVSLNVNLYLMLLRYNNNNNNVALVSPYQIQ